MMKKLFLIFTLIVPAFLWFDSKSQVSSSLREQVNLRWESIKDTPVATGDRTTRKGFLPIRFEPTWKREPRTESTATSTARFSLYNILGRVMPTDRIIVLQIYRANKHSLNNRGSSIKSRHLQSSQNTSLIANNVENEEEQEELAVNIAFEDIYKTIIFITATWLLGKASVGLGMPSLVGEIVTGFLLGPPLADFVPFPEAMVLIGNFGLIGLILESGMDIDVAQLKETGVRAIFMAFVGTSIPLVVGWALGYAAGEDLKSAVAVGAAFSPSSLGVAANVLQAGQVLNTPTGQLIVASSVVDDVLGLILLSILEVFVKEDPSAFDFILPFLSSFGFLLVLGYSGITWMPYLIENKILPRFEEDYQPFVGYCLVCVLLIIYLPLLNYCNASYLTGAFLAGLPFSQIHSVHASFSQNGRQLLHWLLRIFFAATIGFQVPITYFTNLYVLRWGSKFLVPVLAKLPLGLFIPRRSRKHTPQDFPYDPYWRDVITTSLAVLCRGEFNFIIASYALSAGLIGPNLYSAIVFAVLLSSIFGPLILAKVIQYYNEKSRAYMEGDHPIEQIGDTCDGYRPLFLAIQARTPVHWGLQETLQKAVESAGLIVIDHRSWHTLGHDAVDLAHCLEHELGHQSVDISELFVQDTKVKVKVPACFAPATSLMPAAADKEIDAATEKNKEGTVFDAAPFELTIPGSASIEENELIQRRCEEIKEILTSLLKCKKPDDYVIKVSQWAAFTFHNGNGAGDVEQQQQRRRFYSFQSFSELPSDAKNLDNTEFAGESQRNLADNLSITDIVDQDLWDADPVARDVARRGYTMCPDSSGYGDHVVESATSPLPHHRRKLSAAGNSSGHHRRKSSLASGPSTHHRRKSSTASAIFAAAFEELTEEQLESIVIKDRLHGYVRHATQVTPKMPGRHHRRQSSSASAVVPAIFSAPIKENL